MERVSPLAKPARLFERKVVDKSILHRELLKWVRSREGSRREDVILVLPAEPLKKRRQGLIEVISALEKKAKKITSPRKTYKLPSPLTKRRQRKHHTYGYSSCSWSFLIFYERERRESIHACVFFFFFFFASGRPDWWVLVRGRYYL